MKASPLALALMFSLSTMLFYPIRGSSLTTIYVNPSTTMATVGQNFTISIDVSNVVDLYGWEFKLRWNSTLLDYVNVTEGDFLRSGGDTFFWPIINNTEGYIHVASTLLGVPSGVNGNGTLATVKFYVERPGECVLDLHDTKLGDSNAQPITHNPIDGYGYFKVMNVHFTLVTLYVVNLYVNETFEYGSSLKVMFHSYSGIYQANSTVWNGTTPTSVTLSKNLTHPLGFPVEKAILVLTDENGTTLQTVASFVVRRSHLMDRLTEFDALWVLGCEKPPIFLEIVAIDGQWPYAPP